MVGFEGFYTTLKSIAKSVWKSPLSGQKRSRDDHGASDHNQQSKVQARGQDAPAARLTEIVRDSGSAIAAPAVGGKTVRPSEAIYGTLFAATNSSSRPFDLGGTIRSLAPQRASNTVMEHSLNAQQVADQGKPSLNGNNAAAIAQPQINPAISTKEPNACVNLRPHPAQAQPPGSFQQANSHAHRSPSAQQHSSVAPSQFAYRGAQATPKPGPPAATSTGQTGTHMKPRQLFATPESTRQRLGRITLSSVPRPSLAPAAGPGLGAGSSSAFGTPLPTGLPGGSVSLPSPLIPWQRLPPEAQHQPHLPAQPFARVYAALPAELAATREQLHRMTADELRAHLAQFEAMRSVRYHQRSAAPVREDGGYVGGDVEETDNLVATKTKEAMDLVRRLKSIAGNTARASASDRRVIGPARDGVAARTTLALTQAMAGPEAKAAVDLKVAAHERQVQQMRRSSEADTQRQLEAVKAQRASQRAQLEQERRQYQQRVAALQPSAPPPAQAAPAPGSKAAASRPSAAEPRAAAVDTRRGPPVAGKGATTAAPGRGGPAHAARGPPSAGPGRGRGPVRVPPKEDDTLDLVSSEEEEAPAAKQQAGDTVELLDDSDEEEAEEEQDSEAEEEGEESEVDDEYGGEYGTYGDEMHGGGNPALRHAIPPERSSWRRTMDTDAPANEVLVRYVSNPALPNNAIQLPREKLQCLEVATWLNDEVINLYMMLLQARDTRLRAAAAAAVAAGGRAAPRCHFFNSFFYDKLFQEEGEYKYANVRRWTQPAKLKVTGLQTSPVVLELDRIIIPIHKGVHWTCAVVDLRERAVRYYDSLKGEDPRLTRHLLRWVMDEAADKLNQRWDTSTWRCEFPKSIPTQSNGCDCGVFTIMFADCLGAGRPMSFTQAEMDLIRVKVLHRLFRQRVD